MARRGEGARRVYRLTRRLDLGKCVRVFDPLSLEELHHPLALRFYLVKACIRVPEEILLLACARITFMSSSQSLRWPACLLTASVGLAALLAKSPNVCFSR